MNENSRNMITAVAAMAVGLSIGWIDSRPHWDDTGITVTIVFSASALFGSVNPRHPWIWALLIGIGIPLWNIVLSDNYASVIAIAIAFIGASLSAFLRRKYLSRP